MIYGVFTVLPLIALRLGYGMSVLLIRVEHPWSSFIRSTAALTLLEVIPEILIILVYLVVGLYNRDIKKHLRVVEREELVVRQATSSKPRNSISLSDRR